MRGRTGKIFRCRTPAGFRFHLDGPERGRRGENHRFLRRYRQCGSAHHPGPRPLPRGGLCGDGVHLRRPKPHGGLELHGRSGQDHRRDHGPGRQRGDPLLCSGPYPGAFVFHPGDQGSEDGEVQPGFPGLHRLSPCQTGHPDLYRRPPRISGRGRAEASGRRHAYVQFYESPYDRDGGRIPRPE
ncbi:hypothetical protein SDC9_174970 [bioreactor metagenome]|uniref:Uncharacterized protein n=1 Tax=bioreactor metagenome TaxID=1076179 RepID=A0A645GMX1_9ZZZZ